MARIVDPEGRETEVLHRLVALHGKDVCDIGCGEGRTTRRMAQTAASVLGVDPDVEAITRARDAAPDRGADGSGIYNHHSHCVFAQIISGKEEIIRSKNQYGAN